MRRPAFFDERSPYLDRFGPLLALTVATVAGMSLIDLYAPEDATGRQVASTVVGLMIGVTLLLALRASGVARRWCMAGDVLFGLAAYLLIALAFCYLQLLVDGVQSEPFFAGTTDEPTTSFMYFSLVSITTLGYGDLAPATDLGRLVATTEAVIGQVYLVTFVAMLVGLLIQARDRDSR